MALQQYLLNSFKQHSENTALIHDGVTLSYQELYTYATKIAGVLIDKDLEHISISLIYKNKLQLVIAMLGVILSRNTFVPIPSKTPQDRIKKILTISNSQLILSDHDLDFDIEYHNTAKLLCSMNQINTTHKMGNVDDLSHIYFTSGSTGEPKGIMGRNGSLLSFMTWMIKQFNLNSNDIVLQLSGEGFSLFKREVLATLISGATLCIPTDEDKSSFEGLANFIAKHRVSIFNVVPSYYNYLVNYLSIKEHPSLRTIFIAGEILYKSLVHKHISQLDRQCKLVNLYGPTETTQAKFYYELDFDNLDFDDIVPVGYPINNVTYSLIYDEFGNAITAPNIRGEVIIVTKDSSYGYCDVKQNTPFIKINETEAFKSGDLGYFDDKNRLHVIGRVDSQVKIRGMRVELTEIESQLLKINLVEEAAVLYLQENVTSDGQLVAFIVSSISQDQILSQLTQTLPDYMIPVRFEYLTQLPKNRNNKIDRRTLKDIIINKSTKSENVIFEQTDDEISNKLINIWQQIFTQPFSINDDFFSLGGNSLLVMSIANQIHKVFDIKLNLNTFYDKRTIKSLAQYIRLNIENKDDSNLDFTITKGEYTDNYFPLTHIQQAYVLGRFGDYKLGGIATKRYIEYKFNEHIDINKLEQSINQLIERHAMLRTSFVIDQMLHMIHPEFNYQLIVNDYTAYDDILYQQQVINIREEFLSKTLDITQLPLFNIQISRGNSFDTLHFLSDILIIDANSLNIFRNELTVLYEGKSLEKIEFSFRDYIESNASFNYSLTNESRFYWLNRFKEVPNIHPIKTKESPESIKTPHFKRNTKVVAQDIWQQFRSRAYNYNLSPTSALLSIYYYVLSKYSTNPNFLINISLFDTASIGGAKNNIIGDFTDILAFLPYTKNETNYLSLVQRNHTLLWNDLAKRQIDGIEVFSLIKQKFNLASDSIIAPLVFTSIMEDNQTEYFLKSGSHEEFYLSQTAQVWLDNNATESNGQLISGWDYVTQLFDAKFIEYLHSTYIGLIEHFATHNWDVQIPEIYNPDDLLVIQKANSTTQDLINIKTVKDQALLSPNNIAVIDCNGSLTYNELINKSYSIADTLFNYGVKAGELVAILSEKGYQQVVAAWGVMKISAAYLPLHVDWPIGRIEDVLHEGQVKSILVSKKQLHKISIDSILSKYQILVIEDIENQAYRQMISTPLDNLDQMAYVLFTSGSTGKPKGVVISYLGALNTIEAINRRFQIGSNDAVLALSELSFDLSVYDIFGILATGGRVVFPDQERVKEPGHWYELIDKHKITVWNTVPQLMQLLVDYTMTQHKSLDSLRVVLLSGDWIPTNLAQQIKAINPNIIVMSLGGATEGSIWSIWHEITTIDANMASIPYGVAMPNQKMYVLNNYGEHCPVGIIGEIYIGGMGVALGYWNDQIKTEASFFNHQQLGRIYKTGDLGAWNSNGYIEFHGRSDYQVKINGYRIELEEISAKLNKVPGIDNAITQVYSNAGRDYIIGYLVTNNSYSEINNDFKLKTIGIRQDIFEVNYDLDVEVLLPKYKLRKSYRNYIIKDIIDDVVIDKALDLAQGIITNWDNLTNRDTIITRTILSDMLSVLSCITLEDRVLPKYLYPSAGSSYGVQAYLNIDNAINDITSGYYYFNPMTQSLGRVDTFTNMGITQGLMSIDLIIYLPAITPLYKDESLKFAYIEAGHVLALLQEKATMYGIATTIEACDIKLNEDNILLARLILNSNSLTNLANTTQLNKLIKNTSGVYLNEKHIVDLKQSSIFTQANWYSGRLLETGNVLITLDGEQLPSNLLYAGMYFQLIGQLLYKDNIGSCMLGYNVYPDVLYAMVLGVIDNQEKLKSDSQVNDKPLKEYIDEYLINQLPEYMLPYQYVMIDKLPLTVNGKLDLKQLPTPDIGSSDTAYIAPQNELEIKICQIFSQELGLDFEQIGILDDFFRLGGNSILAIKLASILNNTFDSNIKVSDIFKYKTVKDITHLIRNTHGDFIYKKYRISESDYSNLYLPFELNNVQQAYYVGRHGSFELGNTSTHAYSEYKFRELDINRLEQALNKVIHQHLGLRTIFKNGMQEYIEYVDYYKIAYFEFAEKASFINLRDSLSHKIYNVETYPLFDIIVSKCDFEDTSYYVLHISFDILLMDGNSVKLLYDELTKYYKNPELQVIDLTVTYRDYILQLNKIRSSDLFTQDKTYWLNKLPEYNFDFNLPIACKPSEIKEPHFKRLSKTISKDVWDKLKAQAFEHELGLTSIIMVIYGKVLSYWSNQQHLCINLTLFNRLPLHSQINQIIGDFTVLELFNYQTQINTNIIQELKSNHNQLWQDIEHNLFDGVDFQRLIREEKQLDSTQIIAPIVLTSVLSNDSTDNEFLDSSYLGKNYSISQSSQVWLLNHAYTNQEGFVAEWDYVEQLFNDNVINQMHNDYCNLIEYIANANWTSDQFLGFNSVNTDLIEEINSAIQVIPNNTLFGYAIDYINTHALGNNIAVVDSNRSITYTELFTIANKVSYQLIESSNDGLTHGKLVAVLSEKGINQVVATLGIMQAGHAYLPLNIDWPIQRLIEVLDTAMVEVVLISQDIINNSDYIELKQKYNCIIIEEVITNENIVLELPIVNPDDIAYVIFTSGSTGKPKGVTISHRGALNTLLAVNDKYKVTSQDKVFALSELSFDLSVYDIFGMLIVGGTIVYPKQELNKDPAHWQDLIQQHQITIWNSVPQLAELLIENTKPLSSLRLFLLSGDWIPLNLPDKLKQYSVDTKVISLGGATEGSIWSIWYEVDKIENYYSSIPYGIAMPNQKMYIFNNELNYCPTGVIGEIYIGGLGVALNYYQDNERTNLQFINHDKLGRVYKTGDLGKLNDKGYIEFLGRADNQVKLNGYRVELNEISVKIMQLSGIDDVIVNIQTKNNKNYVVAYLIIDPVSLLINLDNEQLKDNLNQQLEDILPEYMLPHIYVKLDKIPLTSNGKVDLKQLTNIDIITTSNNYVAPVNLFEITLCDIYSAVLNKDIGLIGTHDNFFQLGGDSIIAIRLIGKINQELNIKLSVKDIFVYKTITKLAQYISSLETTDNQILTYTPFSLINKADYTSIIDHSLIDDIYPASYLQVGMLFESNNSQYSTYHVVISNKFNIHFDENRFLAIWQKLINKYELLRSAFIMSDNSYDCIIYKDIDLNYTLYKNASTSDLISTECNNIFDYTKPGLFRVIINQISNEFDLILSFHHAITDGWSISRLMNEFIKTYNFDQKIEYNNELDYALFVKQERLAANNAKYIAFWQEYLVDLSLPMLNWSDNNINQINYGLNTTQIILDSQLTDKIHKITNMLQISPDSLFMYVYIYTLSRFFSQKDVTIGLVMNNRPEVSGGDDLFGLFLNTIPYRFKLEGIDINENLKAIYNEKIKLYEYKYFPYARIKELIGHDLYSFAFNYTNFQIATDGITNTGYDDYQRSNIPFVLNVALKQDFIIDFIAHDSFCSQEYLEYISLYFKEYLYAISSNQNLFPVIKDDYTKFTQTSWQNHNSNNTLVDLFNQQVLTTPDSIALKYQDISLTYIELNNKVNQLANYILVNYIIKPDDLITLCLDRSEQMIIAILAVMKSGAAYVPIDPSYPVERINYIINDAQAVLHISTQNNYSLFNDIDDRLLIIDDDVLCNKIANQSMDNPHINITSSNLVYVIYTSGTTGQPKGVMIEHKSVINLAINMYQRHKLNQNSVVSVYANYVFDAFICELIPALLNGNQVVLLSNDERLSLELLTTTLIKNQVNLAFIPSILVGEFINYIQDQDTSLNMIFAGGDKLAEIDVNKLSSNLTIINEYGPTESTVCTTLNYLSSSTTLSNIGKPLDNIQVYILDQDQQLLPMGVIGELYIGGDCLARGYLNQGELTKERFINNPYQNIKDKQNNKNNRLYKTGDLVKYLADGSLVFIGRNDHQVKIRGFRIELAEVEVAVTRISDEIKQSIAVAYNNQHITVYYVADKELEISHIRSELAKALPAYMLPTFIIHLEKLPLSINGKLDYKALPVPTLESNSQYVAPSSTIEHQVCIIVAEILNLNTLKVGVLDNFFRLGGNSMLAIRLVARLNKFFNKELKIADILMNSNINQLVSLIDNHSMNTYNPLIKLNNIMNDKPFIFMIHPGQAGCEVYLPLALSLNDSYSCYGIDNYNLHNENKITSLSQLSQYYVDILLANQLLNEQPIILLGWSLGGLIALEMATILENMGYINIKLYLLDTIIFDEKLCEIQDLQTSNQKIRLEEYMTSQAYEHNYIDKVIQNFDMEISLMKTKVSQKLKSTQVILFKALEEDNQFDGEVSRMMIEYILQQKMNNIEQVISDLGQLEMIDLGDAHHWNILGHKAILEYFKN